MLSEITLDSKDAFAFWKGQENYDQEHLQIKDLASWMHNIELFRRTQDSSTVR